MTDAPVPSGEQLASARRRKFWSFLVLGTVIAMIIGGIAGGITDLTKDGDISPLWLIVATAAAVIGFTVFSVEYYRRVDEVDLQDNLWANFIGAHVFIVAFGVWWTLAEAGLLVDPDAMILCAITLLTIFATYGWRKLRNA